MVRSCPFAEGADEAAAFLRATPAAEGGDYPEALEAALCCAATAVRWTAHSTRLAVWLGDAPPHG